MIVIVDKRRSTGIGESLSGEKAFFINAKLINNWLGVETNPEYQHLSTQEQDEIRDKFPRSVLVHQCIEAIHFT